MNFSHYIVLYGIRVLVQLDINVDALANDLGAKAADNASGKASVRFGNVKAAVSVTDRIAIRDAREARRQATRALIASGKQP